MIDFPNSPTTGTNFSSVGLSWNWDGTKWKAGTFTAPATTTWNPADQQNTTLTGGNLTTQFTGTSTNSAVRSVFGATSSKYYFEIHVNNTANLTFGFSQASVSLSTLALIGAGSPAANTISFGAGTAYLYVGTTIAVNFGTASSAGDVIQFAIDMGAKLLWVRANAGNWNNNASYNPATGTGGVDITSVVGAALYAYCGGQQNAGVTANFGASAFAYTAPTGFKAGFG